MTNLTESSTWESGIFQLETNTPTLGGAPGFSAGVPVAGHSNVQAQQLANRTKYLDDNKVNNADLADTTDVAKGSSLVGFKQDGVNAVGRTVQEKLADMVNVKDFGAIGDGVTDDTAAFNSASTYASSLASGLSGDIRVPVGTYNITSPITTGANWYLDGASTITGLPTVGSETVPIHDTSYLTGRVFDYRAGSAATLRIGDPNPWLTKDWRPISECISTFSSINDRGRPAGLFATRTSGNSGSGSLGYALSASIVNDKTDTPYGGWSVYLESYRAVGAGNTFGMESDFINMGDTIDLNPYSGLFTGITANLWISCGGGSTPHAVDAMDISAGAVFLPNSKGFNRGIVFRENSVVGTEQEAIASPLTYKFAWYYDSSTRLGYLDGQTHSRTVLTATLTDAVSDVSRRRATSLASAPLNGTVVYQHTYQAHNATSYTTIGTDVVRQEADFSAGTARFSRLVSAANGDGSTAELTLNRLAANTLSFLTDGVVHLGTASTRFLNVFSRYLRPGAGTVIWTSGAGTPEGVVTAVVGSMYTDTTGGAGTTLYIKESGTGNTGWVAK